MWEWLQTESRIFFFNTLKHCPQYIFTQRKFSSCNFSWQQFCRPRCAQRCPGSPLLGSHFLWVSNPDQTFPPRRWGAHGGLQKRAWVCSRKPVCMTWLSVVWSRHPSSSPAFKVMKIDHFLSCGQRNFSSIFGNYFRKTVDILNESYFCKLRALLSSSLLPLFSASPLTNSVFHPLYFRCSL